MHIIWCKKVDTWYGFKAYGEDLNTTETLTSSVNCLSTKIVEIGERMDDEPGSSRVVMWGNITTLLM